jgi:hypothetical protein
MELLHGNDFRRIIQRHEPVPLTTKIEGVAQICEAVAHAHRHGVLHRDIKPSNLFLTDEGRGKVLDFGIARLPSSRLTVAGQILETANYMAPELILAGSADGRANLFSVAVVFFELLTWSHPFQGTLVPLRIVQGEPDSLFDYDSTLPVILERVLARGLAKEPDQRYQTGDEFAADLRAVLDAIHQNASPSFSHIQLPSQKAVPPAQPSSQPSQIVSSPEGVDPHEWRLSEALRLLPEIEAAIDERDASRARCLLTQLESRIAGDIRSAEALKLCRSRLNEITAAAPTSAASDTVAPVLTSSAQAAAAPASATETATSPETASGLDATSFGPAAHASTRHPAFTEGAPAAEPKKGLAVLVKAASKLPKLPGEWERYVEMFQGVPPETKKYLAVGTGAAVCVILVLIAAVTALRPLPAETALAIALVNRSATIYDGPTETGKRIATVLAGTQLNVLRLPVTAGQQWIRVQRVKPKVQRPGYVTVGELRDWQGQTGAAALALLHVFGPGNAATPNQIQEQIGRLNELIARFSSDPAANQARLDILEWRRVLAERQYTAGAQSGDEQIDLAYPRQEMEALIGNPQLQGRVNDLLKRTDVLRAAELRAPAPPSKPTRAPAVPNVQALLANVRQLRNDGDYERAQQVLRQIFQYDPANKEAVDLKNKIDRALQHEQDR